MLQEFMVMMGADPARAFYGPPEVFAANDMGAIHKLLISDSLFRYASKVAQRGTVGFSGDTGSGSQRATHDGS